MTDHDKLRWWRFNLNAALKNHKHSLTEVAARAGIHSVTLYKLREGDRSPSLDVAVRLAEAMDYPIQSMLLPPGRFAKKYAKRMRGE